MTAVRIQIPNWAHDTRGREGVCRLLFTEEMRHLRSDLPGPPSFRLCSRGDQIAQAVAKRRRSAGAGGNMNDPHYVTLIMRWIMVPGPLHEFQD
jgi:hypothetical protein